MPAHAPPYDPETPGSGCLIPAMMGFVVLALLWLCSGCTVGPAMIGKDGTKITTGGSLLTKKENHYARVTLPDGTVLETGAAKSDETATAHKIISAGTIRSGLNSLDNAVKAAPAIVR